MVIHALTLTYNGFDKLEQVYAGLSKTISHMGNDSILWHIRDNGSKDNTVDQVKSWNNINLYEIGHNRDTFSQGVNYLFEKASPKDDDLLLLLNNDITINDSNSLNEMIKLLTDDVGIVGSRLLYPDNKTLQHAGVIFSEKYWSLPYHYRHKELDDVQSQKNRYFQAITGAFLLMRAKDFRLVNGLDEGFKWAFEDIDLCLKVLALGKKIAYCGKTNITHIESATLVKNPLNKLFLSSNMKYFKQKWFGKYNIDNELYLKDQNYNLIK
jgi:GT2 family glycosyltransferase